VERKLIDERQELALTDFNLGLVDRPDLLSESTSEDESDIDFGDITPPWLDQDCVATSLPFTSGCLHNSLLHRDGIVYDDDEPCKLALCCDCFTVLQANQLPALSLANQTFLGKIPLKLKDLTPIEESMIALCRAKCCIVQLKEENEDATNSINQKGMKGNIIIYPQ
jgi:hypothetical protein